MKVVYESVYGNMHTPLTIKGYLSLYSIVEMQRQNGKK